MPGLRPLPRSGAGLVPVAYQIKEHGTLPDIVCDALSVVHRDGTTEHIDPTVVHANIADARAITAHLIVEYPDRQCREAHLPLDIFCDGAENAISHWLRDNRTAIRELTGQRPLYVLNTKPESASAAAAIDILPDRRGRPVIRYKVIPNGALASSGPSDQPIMRGWEIRVRRFFTKTAADL